MKLISNNPYREAGILSNASARELIKQKSKITAYLKVGKSVSSDFDFNFLQKIARTEDSTKAAFSKIEQSKDRVFHSLFWFLEVNSFDTIALGYLKEGDVLKAGAIWKKVTYGKQISDLNYSSFSNLGTLKLLGDSELETQEGIEAKIKLIESPSFKDYVHAVADETFTIDRQSQIEHFIDALFDEFNSYFQTEKITELFVNCNGIASEYVTKKSTQEPISYLEMKIDSTKSRRNENKIKAYEYGLRLHADCLQDLSSLRSILGEQNLKYKMIADKLAKEIIKCAIDYFEVWEGDKDVSEQSLELLKYAQSIAVGNLTQERIKDQIETVEEQARIVPIRDDLTFITNKVEALKHKADSILNAEDLLTSCQPKLQSIKLILGSRDELYINISNMVVFVTQQMLVTVLNDAQQHLVSHNKITALKEKVKKAFLVHNKLGELDMSDMIKGQYLKNHKALKSLANQLNISTNSNRSSSTPFTFLSLIKLWPLIIIGIAAIIGLISVGNIGGLILGGIGGLFAFMLISWIIEFIEWIMRNIFTAIVLFLGTTNVFAQQVDTSFTNELQELKAQIHSQQQDIDKLYSELNKEYRTYRTLKSDLNQAIIVNQKKVIDSLNMLIDKSSQKLTLVNEDLGTRIQQTSENAHSQFSELDNSLNKNRLYWIIATMVMLLFGGLIYWLLSKRIQSNKTDVETQIRNTRKSLEEEGIKLDNQLVEVLTKQLKVAKAVDQSGSPSANENDHSLVLKVADRLTAMETNHYKMDPKTKGLKQLIRAVKSIKENYLANGYEIVEMVGNEYKEGMNVIANFIPSEKIDTDKRVITRIIKPQVNYNGKIIQAAQIEVSVGE